jgi:hypothetical protein
MAMFDLSLIFHRIIYFIVHYFSAWTILTCLIAAGVSWRLFTIYNSQNSGDAHLAWWTTAVWSSIALLFFLVGFLFS